MAEFPVPQAVHTSVKIPELRLLQRYAREAGTVLEIGTHYGFTCIGMALAGAHVTSVDPHYEGPANDPDTWKPFLANMDRHEIPYVHHTGQPDWDMWQALYLPRLYIFPGRGSVVAVRSAVEALELPDDDGFGAVLIDGDHVWPAPMRDARIALSHLKPPAYLAFHDVTPNWPGVWRTVKELVESGELVKLGQVGTLAVYQAHQK